MVAPKEMTRAATSPPPSAAPASPDDLRHALDADNPLEVLQMIVDGKSNKEIATALELSANTIAVHRANIMNALGVHKTAELVVYAIQHGLVNLP